MNQNGTIGARCTNQWNVTIKECEVNTIAANQLQPNQAFRKPGQRKWRIASKVIPQGPSVTLSGSPQILVCLSDCSQMDFSEDDAVEIPETPSDLDTDGFIKLGKRRK